MKLQFKVQQYQTDAVDAVVDVFAGQPKHDGVSYRIDPGKDADADRCSDGRRLGLRNAEIALTPTQLAGQHPPGAAVARTCRCRTS